MPVKSPMLVLLLGELVVDVGVVIVECTGGGEVSPSFLGRATTLIGI